MKKQASKPKNWIQYYDDRDILNEITDESVDLVLNKRLRDDILSGKRKRNLKNVTIKVDPLQIKAIKKHLHSMYSLKSSRGSSRSSDIDRINSFTGWALGP